MKQYKKPVVITEAKENGLVPVLALAPVSLGMAELAAVGAAAGIGLKGLMKDDRSGIGRMPAIRPVKA